MKKSLSKLLIFFLTLVMFKANAQSFKAKQMDINLGLGLGSTYRVLGAYGYRPPISASAEYGITDDISLGVYLGYTGYSYQYKGTDWCNNSLYNYVDTYSWSFYIVGLRGAYHFAKLVKDDKIDLYGGLMMGNNFYSTKYSTNAPCSNHYNAVSTTYPHFAYALFGGCRYRFNDKFGIFGELGYGISYLTFGLNIKL